MWLEAEHQPGSGAPDPDTELVIDFGAAGNSSDYRRAGWANPEARHTWTKGQESRLVIPPLAAAGTYRLRIRLWPFVWAPALPGQRLAVLVNGHKIAEFLVREARWLECHVDAEMIGRTEPVVITLHHPDAARPSETSGARDDREIALAFQRLVLQPEMAAPDIGPGRRNEPEVDSLRGHFQSREYFAWISFWAQIILLGFLAILGAFFASERGEPGAYSCGLWISFAAVALAFMRLKQYFDVRQQDSPAFLFGADVSSLIAVGGLFAALVLTGLLLAANKESGTAHDTGLILSGASGLAVLLNIKRIFDQLYARGTPK